MGYKKTLYFQGEVQTIAPPNLKETYVLKKRDILQIKISNPDAESPEVLTPNTEGQIIAENAYFTDYYINDSGYVELPMIGKLKIEGYTLMQADSAISYKAKEYFSYATAEVRFASFKFLALGEFETPGQYYVSNETCTLYEAIAIAGDVADYANTEKVQLIRTLDDGSKKVYHLNLTDYSAFNSDTYYIQPNDIIYIQPQKAKVDKQNVIYVSIGMSALLFLTVVLGRLGV
ncbi:MAG: polysaccharide biosynthesis/export family protein [Cytophaga sp.]|uniref:polysaccharide biosynthesis/export family protein n=1 Tax=Cytophaga sp. TaxID=29535 RepID=UPI003F7EF553